MPGVDWIPGVSQVKSLCQLVTGDLDGAAKTQENFSKECPVVSQVTSVVQIISGDKKGAIETQKRCLGTINNVANGIPVVGHIKGGVHHAFGDHEGGNQALQAATRSTVVIGSGVAAGFASGGIAAIPVGIAAGSAYDLAESAISDKPKGVFAGIQNAVDNPNAGNIFDAAAVFVGDGLAGYSGGQIGKQISTQVKLNSLETVRAAKMDQIDSALFAEEGAAKSMTTGQLTSLGQQVNALTSEINAIRHGTPQYWFDVKTRQVVVEQTTGGVKVAVVNVATDGIGVSRQENALKADCYEGEHEVALSPEERNNIINKYVEQETNNENLVETYSKSTIKKDNDIEKLNELLKNFQKDNDPIKQLKKIIESFAQFWHHVQMPLQFGYTGAILSNDSGQGLLHTFARHWDQWQEYIPSLRNLIKNLPEHIRQLLQNVRDAQNLTQSRKALKKFSKAINEKNKIDDESYVSVQKTLLEIQMKLLEFLKRNITSVQYLEHGVNGSGQVQVYLNVTNSSGNQSVMVVAMSEQLFPMVEEFGDSRPVRSIITVFFLTRDEFENFENRTRRAWP